MIPPWGPPQFGHPTITGTIVGLPLFSVDSQVLPSQAVFVVASVEKSDGADVRLKVTRVEVRESLP